MGSDAQGVAVPRPLHTTVASLEQSGKLPLAVIVEPLLNLGQQLMGPNERVALPFRPSPFPSDRRPSLPTVALPFRPSPFPSDRRPSLPTVALPFRPRRPGISW
jgi:hypothetical protein